MTELDTYIFYAGANFSLPSFLVLNLNINIRMHKSLGSIFKITVKTFCSFSVPTKLVTVCEPFITCYVSIYVIFFYLPIQFTYSVYGDENFKYFNNLCLITFGDYRKSRVESVWPSHHY